jgi:hypothetical protein
LALEAVEEHPLGEQVVRLLVVGRDAALVTPPETCGAPVGLLTRRQLERRTGRVSAGQRDVLAGTRRCDEEIGRGALCLAR